MSASSPVKAAPGDSPGAAPEVVYRVAPVYVADRPVAFAEFHNIDDAERAAADTAAAGIPCVIRAAAPGTIRGGDIAGSGRWCCFMCHGFDPLRGRPGIAPLHPDIASK